MADLLSSVVDSVISPFSSMATNWLTNTSRESLSKNVTQSNLKAQKNYDQWSMAQDRNQEKWMQEYYYALQNNEYFNLAKKYGTNTASWAVEGLKKAGLNPILAAGNFNMSSNTGSASPASSGSSSGRRSSIPSSGVPSALSMPTNIASAMQASSASELAKAETARTKQTTPYEVFTAYLDTKLKELQPAEVKANTAETLSRAAFNAAEAERVRAATNTEREKAARMGVDRENAAKNKGLNGPAGAAVRYSSDYMELLTDGIKSLLRNTTGVAPSPHSAKSAVPPPPPPPRTPQEVHDRYFGGPKSDPEKKRAYRQQIKEKQQRRKKERLESRMFD